MQVFQQLVDQIRQLFVWLVIVAPWEQALRIRLGRRVSVLDAGWWLVIPFVDRVYRQSIRRRLSVIASQTVTSADGKHITVSGSIGYEIVNLEKLYNAMHHPEDTIEALVSGLIARYIAQHAYADCLPAQLENHVAIELDLKRFGLGAQEFYITNFLAAKSYRIITGEVRSYLRGDHLNTNTCDGGAKV